MNKHTIWSNCLDFEDWREDLEINFPNETEQELRRRMVETNETYLGDEQINLLSTTVPAILVIFSTRDKYSMSQGFTFIRGAKGVSVSRCLGKDVIYGYEYEVKDDSILYDWFVDGDGEFRCETYKNECKSMFLYRAVKEDADLSALANSLYIARDMSDNNMFNKLVRKYTMRLGDAIGKVYGWEFPAVKV